MSIIAFICCPLIFLPYGIYGTLFGIFGFLYPCNHDVVASITNCTASLTYGEFKNTIEYVDYLGAIHHGTMVSTVPCMFDHMTICYLDRDPGDYRNDVVFFKSRYTAPFLLVTGLACLIPFFLMICCPYERERERDFYETV
jgi:hypothetical protein